MLAEKRYDGDDARHRGSMFSQSIKTFGVSRTAEFIRIEALPRRAWETAEDLEELTQLLTRDLKQPDGDMTLWPVQAAALRDLHDTRGLIGSMAVGEGKALVSLLAPVVLESERPLLLVPADVREQTNRKVIPEMRQHWKLHPNLRVMAYSELSSVKNQDILQTLQPDLIIADEAHSLARVTSARTRRVNRYMTEFEETIFAMLSGTITRKGLRDYWHLTLWSMKPIMCPLPVRFNELQDWADCLDADVDEEKRIAPGALEKLCAPGENTRQGFMRRFTETPGVIATKNTELPFSLRIHKKKVKGSGKMSAVFERVAADWETPDGNMITESMDLARKLREISTGFYYQWDPAAPVDWLDARKEWKRYVRETLKHNRRKLDTELQVWNEQLRKHDCPLKPAALRVDEDGHIPSEELALYEQRTEEWAERVTVWEAALVATHCMWCGWKIIKASFKPNNVPVWLDDFLVIDATEWLNKNAGIVWTTQVAFAERLAEVSGRPYFGAGKKASIEILDASGPIIASIAAHGQGKNLQHQYCKNLVICCPPAGKTWEQLLGRTHRRGQPEDEVVCEVYMHTDALRSAWHRAKNIDAPYLEDTTGVRQKLRYADITFEV